MEKERKNNHLYKGKYGPFDAGLEKEIMQDLHNTPLEEYATKIFNFLIMDTMQAFDDVLPRTIREELLPYIDECLNLSKYLKTIKSGILKGPGWKINSKDDIASIYDNIESLMMNKLDFSINILDDLTNPKFRTKTLNEWLRIFEAFPNSNHFDFDDKEVDEYGTCIDGGYQRLSEEEIDYLVHKLEEYNIIAKGLTLKSDGSFVNQFLKYMLLCNVPKSRKVYLELYKVLDNLGYIPYEVKHSHQTSISKYNESNYIKSLVNTIIKNNG